LRPGSTHSAIRAPGLRFRNVRTRDVDVVEARLLVAGEPVVYYHYSSLQVYRQLTVLTRLRLTSNRYRLTRGPIPLVWPGYAVPPGGRPLLASIRSPHLGRDRGSSRR
jgi:hypothetical protein